MIEVKTGQLPDKVGEVVATLRKFNKRTIVRMSQYQRKIEQTSMLPMPKGQYAPPGTPPFTHPRMSKKGNSLPAFPQSIQYNPDLGTPAEPRAIVGPVKSSKGRKKNWAERIGRTHEFGGTATVEKRVMYRPVQAGESGIYLGGGARGFRLVRSTSTVLFKKNDSGGVDKTFDFTTRRVRSTKSGKIIFEISYRATYPKRPFAAPALRKTVAALRQGKFGQ